MSVEQDLVALKASHPELAERLAELRTLEDFFETYSSSLADVEFLVQDEFSHDVFLPLPEGFFLVVGAT